VLFFSISGLVALIVLAYLVGIPLIEKKIVSQLKQLEPEVLISYSSLHVHLFDAAVGLDDVDIRFIPNLQEKRYHHTLHIHQLRLSGIDFFALIRGKELKARLLKLDNADIVLDGALLHKEQPLPSGLMKRLHLSIEKIFLSRIETQDMRISVDSGGQNQIRMRADLVLQEFGLNNLKDTFSKRDIQFSSVNGILTDISLPISGTLHKLHIKTLTFNSEEKSASIQSLEIIPDYNKFEIGKRFASQIDYVDARIPEIRIMDFDWNSLLDNKIKARKIIVGKTIVYIFRDRRLPRLSTNQPLPLKYLNSLPFDLRIDTLEVDPSSITYEEFPAKGDQTGILKIERMRLFAAPFINHPGIGDPEELITKVKGAIMGSGEVAATLSMAMKTKGDCLVKGEFNNLDLTTLNSSAEHLGGFHIESGILNSLGFQFQFNEEKSSGEVVGEYHNLIIDKLRETEKHRGEKDLVKSFLLQKLVIPKDKDKSLPIAKRSGKINYKHDPTRFISFYLLKSLLSGVKASFNFGFVLPG